jgi:choline dehydrogenase
VAIRYDGTAPQGHGYQVHVGPMYSDARGTIKIKSTDPREHPAIQFNYLSTKTDRREWIEAVRISRNILNQPAFDAYNDGELSPGPSVETDQEILDWVAKDSETALHPSCTCRLGVGEDSVIDPTSMKVHGVEGLRVIDASAMRYVTNGNIYAPTMMLAEKSADLIMGNTPLAAINEPFYVHQMKGGGAAVDGRAAPAAGGAASDGADSAEAEAPAESPTADG